MWREALLVNSPDAYWTYLERYPDGLYVFDARRRLRRLAAAERPPGGWRMMEFAHVPPPLAGEPARIMPLSSARSAAAPLSRAATRVHRRAATSRGGRPRAGAQAAADVPGHRDAASRTTPRFPGPSSGRWRGDAARGASRHAPRMEGTAARPSQGGQPAACGRASRRSAARLQGAASGQPKIVTPSPPGASPGPPPGWRGPPPQGQPRIVNQPPPGGPPPGFPRTAAAGAAQNREPAAGGRTAARMERLATAGPAEDRQPAAGAAAAGFRKRGASAATAATTAAASGGAASTASARATSRTATPNEGAAARTAAAGEGAAGRCPGWQGIAEMRRHRRQAALPALIRTRDPRWRDDNHAVAARAAERFHQRDACRAARGVVSGRTRRRGPLHRADGRGTCVLGGPGPDRGPPARARTARRISARGWSATTIRWSSAFMRFPK